MNTLQFFTFAMNPYYSSFDEISQSKIFAEKSWWLKALMSVVCVLPPWDDPHFPGPLPLLVFRLDAHARRHSIAASIGTVRCSQAEQTVLWCVENSVVGHDVWKYVASAGSLFVHFAPRAMEHFQLSACTLECQGFTSATERLLVPIVRIGSFLPLVSQLRYS